MAAHWNAENRDECFDYEARVEACIYDEQGHTINVVFGGNHEEEGLFEARLSIVASPDRQIANGLWLSPDPTHVTTGEEEDRVTAKVEGSLVGFRGTARIGQEVEFQGTWTEGQPNAVYAFDFKATIGATS